MRRHGYHQRAYEQRQDRRRRGERAFLFDKDVSSCLADVRQDRWEWAISLHGGDVVSAARACGLEVPSGTKALWGKSAQEAVDTYRRWQKRRQRQRST